MTTVVKVEKANHRVFLKAEWDKTLTMDVLLWLGNNVGKEASFISDLSAPPDVAGYQWYLSTMQTHSDCFMIFRDPQKALLFKLTWC